MRLIEASDVTAILGGRRVLSHVDLTLQPGEIVMVVGPNGSGKSTLLRLLIGAIAPSTGQIDRKPGLRIGYVPQSLRIDETMPLTVRRFLNLPRPAPHSAIRDVVDQAGVAGLEDRQLSALSGGQFQRVLLARALLNAPELLVLDEPTQGLDQPAVASFYRLIEDVRNRWGCAVLMVSHDLHVVMSASDRVICLNGHICCEGTPSVVSAAPEYRALFGHGTGGALALYQHEHNHTHEHIPVHEHDHTHEHSHDGTKADSDA